MEVLSGSCAIKIEPITMRSPVEHVYGNDDEYSDSFYDDVEKVGVKTSVLTTCLILI